MRDVLQEIIEHKRREVERLAALGAPSPVEEAPSPAGSAPPPAHAASDFRTHASRLDVDTTIDIRDFAAAFRGARRAIIAEIKPASPSEGPLPVCLDPITRATAYQAGGASAVSVLTDEHFFGGSLDLLTQVRSAIRLPVLRKDFIIDPSQVVQSRIIGADACLLIVAALTEPELRGLIGEILRLGMTPLVEVHTERELEDALNAGAEVIAINNRNLRDLSMDQTATARLCSRMPDDRIVISASGVTTPEQVGELPDRVNGVLIGTALMKAQDPADFIRRALHGSEAKP